MFITSYSSAQPNITASPTSNSFGSVAIGNSSPPLVVTISNTGSEDLTLGTLSITGTDATEFSIDTDNCSDQILASSETCTVELSFSPTSEGAKSANLSIPSNDPDENPLNIPLTGTGVTTSFPDISVSPPSYDFGNIGIDNSSDPLVVTISNTGSGNLVLGTLSLTGTDATEFSIDIDDCSGQTIAPTGSCTAEVSFLPSSEGAKSANLSIPSNDPDENPVNVPLTGRGVIPTPDIDATPTSFDFGSIDVATSSPPVEITISNTGTGDLQLGTISITGTDKSEFSIDPAFDNCSDFPLAPSESCTVRVAFSPTTAGAKTAKLSIPSDDPDENPFKVSLTGIGIGPCGENPEITSISPKNGTFGDNITIAGTGFCDQGGKVIFSKKGIPIEATIQNWSDTEITTSVPWGLKQGKNQVKVVTTLEAESNTKIFTFIKPIPKISSLSSKTGQIGSEVVITGTLFGKQDENSKVLFGSTEAQVSNWTNESITATVPEMKVKKKGKLAPISIKTTYGISNAKKFKVFPAI